MQDEGAAQLHIIALSKDRAFQLSQLLRSLSEYVLASCSSARVSVIYAVSPGYDAIAESYVMLRQEHASVRFIREGGSGDFQEQLTSLIAEEGYEYIMWAVDDLVFYRHYDVSIAMRLLAQDPSIWCVHPKLHPGVTYSHTLDKPLVLPKLEWSAVLGTSGFVYSRADAMADWNYPWDLCGSIYRARDVRGVMSLIESSFGPGAASHPNKLEYLGHKALIDAQKTITTAASSAVRGGSSRRAACVGGAPGAGGGGDGGRGVAADCRSGGGGGGGDGSTNGHQALMLPLPSKCACSSKPVCSVVTINRVQDVYDTPVYSPMTPHTTTSTPPPHTDGSIHSLEDLGRSGARLDLKAYARASFDGAAFDAVHIGHLLIEARSQIPPTGPSDTPKGISVLLPARNAEKSIVAALTSIVAQELPPSVALEVIVVDDASTDGTAHVCERVARSIEDSHVTIKVLSRETQGNVAVALNQGLERATYPLIARMDADDVCLKGRLMAQIEFLLDHPECDVVGGGVVVTATRAEDDLLQTMTTKPSAVLSVAMHPCDPRFLKWSLLFSCSVAHPSIMARTEALQRAGGYRDDPCARHAEDYDLWLRLCYGSEHTEVEATPEGSNCHRAPIANLPQPLIILRRTPDGANASTTHREEQKVASDAAAARAMTALLGKEVDVVRAAAVRRPEEAATVGQLISAVDLLLELEGAYLTTHASSAGSMDGQGEVWRRAVREDVSNRLRAMAAVGIASYGPLAMKIVMKSSARKS